MSIKQYDQEMLAINVQLDLLERYIDIAERFTKGSVIQLREVNEKVEEFLRKEYRQKINEREALIASQIPF